MSEQKRMDSTFKLIMEQLRGLTNSVSALSSGQEELKTVNTELKTDVCGEFKTEDRYKRSECRVVNGHDCRARQKCSMQKQFKNDIQDEISAINEDLKRDISDLRSGQTEMEESDGKA
jgi:hypothetical protein